MASAISEKYGFIYTHIPKTGGTSIFSRRSSLHKRPEFKHVTFAGSHTRLRNLKVDISKYFKFTIVRNPWDRVVSLWLTRTKQDLSVNFSEYLFLILNRREPTTHVANQSWWVSDDEGNLLIDKFYRYEDYEDTVKEIFKTTMNIDVKKIPHLRRTKRMRNHRIYYNEPFQIEAVRRFYKRDIENFGYEF